MAGDEASHQRFGFLCQAPEIVRMDGPQPLLEFRLLLAQARVDLPAVPSGRREADRLCLDECDNRAFFGEMEGCTQPGEPTAHDTHVRPERMLKDGAAGRRSGTGRVVALGWRRHGPVLKHFCRDCAYPALGIDMQGSYLDRASG